VRGQAVETGITFTAIKVKKAIFSVSLMEKIEQANKRQKPINESLRKQLSDALSKEAINK
jgi:hypothetical protein